MREIFALNVDTNNMFGNIFETEDDIFAASVGENESENGRKAVKGPPQPRPTSNLAGIANQGATCYLNSLLQTLLLTPEFRESLFQIPETELGKLEDRTNPDAKVRIIPLQLQRLFVRLLLLNQQSVSTEDLTQSFGWTNNEQFQQHDVQELNRILFSAIEASLAGTSGHRFIQQLYHGKIVNQIICQGCGKISETEEDFLDLTLSVSDVDSLEKTLSYSYCDFELMDGKNQYRCERCQKLVDAKKGAKIRKLPHILTISLLRFSFDFQKMQRYKETGKFTFPMDLDMSQYVETPSSPGELMYELFSVVVHRGGAYGGHYHAYIRDINSLGHWTCPVESDIEIITDSKKGVVEFVKTNSPEEVIEIILEKEPSHAIAIDKLGSEISKQTGVTWNKRFKRNHGSLVKFLSRCEGRLVYNPHTRWVSLPTASNNTSTSPATMAADVKGHDEAEIRNNKMHQQHSSVSSTDRIPPEGQRWFNFNDSCVSPINVKEIEKHFQGRESAYMLFYRKKTADATSGADRDLTVQMPEWLLSDVLTENKLLDKQREEYEEVINSVTIHLHFEPHYRYHQGALKVKQADLNTTKLTIDRRKTLAELIESVREVGESLISEALVLHRMREIPAGLHLYDCLSEEPEKSVMSLDMENNTKVFVWDGCKVGDSSIPVGLDCEPVFLTIVYGNPSQFSCGYQKNLSLADLRSSVCDLTGIAMSDLKLKKLVGSMESPYYKSLNDDDMTLTLAVLNFQDGDQIIAEDKNSKNKSLHSSPHVKEETFVGKENTFEVRVENRCGNGDISSRQVKNLEVTSDMSVNEVKVMAMSAFEELSLLDGGRLRVDETSLGLRPPLHGDQTLGQAGVVRGNSLVLEHGKAPESNQMTLTFTPLDPKAELPDLEVTVSRTCTVRECVSEMAFHAGLGGDSWHLRKSNWCGEAAEVLDDLDLTLEKSHVGNGDHLLLLEGKLPPKGFLRLPVFLSPPPDNPQLSDSGHPGMMGWITSGIQGLLLGSSTPASDSLRDGDALSVGEVEISQDATLEDLKLQVMTLPGLGGVCIPTQEFMRVRIINDQNDHRPGVVLRDSSQTLRRQKVTSASHIAIQVLPQEERLGPNELVIGIKQRIPGTRTYSPELELVWNTSQGASPQSFRQCVADFLALSVEEMVVAKHFPRQHRWQVVEKGQTKTQAPVQKGKKKGGAKKSSMKNAPYHLQDGDIFGVKTLQGDPDNEDDFSTDADIKGRETIQQEAEEKTKMREERKKEYGDGPRPRRPEVALSIKVDTFT